MEALWRGSEGLGLPVAWGARAAAGPSTGVVNRGQGRTAEQMRQQKVEGEGAAGWEGGCRSISGGSYCTMREKKRGVTHPDSKATLLRWEGC